MYSCIVYSTTHTNKYLASKPGRQTIKGRTPLSFLKKNTQKAYPLSIATNHSPHSFNILNLKNSPQTATGNISLADVKRIKR